MRASAEEPMIDYRKALQELVIAVGNHHDAMVATGDLHTPFMRASAVLLEKSPEVEEQFVYWSARDEHGEWQHYRCSVKEAGALLTEVHKRLGYIASAENHRSEPQRGGE